MTGKSPIHFQERSGLDEHVVFLGNGDVTVGLIVRKFHRQLIGEFFHGFIDRGRVRELGENNQTNVAERPIADDRPFDGREHVPDPVGNLRSGGRVGEIGLACRGQVA